MLHAVIMAGGSGTRFWPVSRKSQPKQLLNLVGERTMIQATADRLGDLVPAERQLVVTNRSLVDDIAAQLPQLPASAVIGEPCKRDTAPCVGLAAVLVRHADPSAIMAVMPADHIIGPDEVFRSAIRSASQMVEEQPGRFVTFGIKPSYAAESFGYIERGEAVADGQPAAAPTFAVHSFHEKPTLEVAKQYLAAGRFYWNSGIFVWKAQAVLDALDEYEPEMMQHLYKIEAAIGQPNFSQVLDAEFSAIEGKSIDYAVMERYPDVSVMESPFDWDDLGSWQSLSRLRGTDNDRNTIIGKHLGLDTQGCTIRTDDEHLVVTLGLKDCIVVHTADATLVARKDDEESIRKIAEMLGERGWVDYL